MLYMLDINVEDRGLSLDALFDVWEQEADAALSAKEAGLIQYIFKTVGQRRVFVVVNVDSHDVLDDILTAKLPLAHHLRINDVVPIRAYENFVASLKKRFVD